MGTREARAIVCALLIVPALGPVQGCKGESLMQREPTTDWLDSREVLDVTYHPRKERDAPGDAKFETLDIAVEPGVTVGGRFHETAGQRLLRTRPSRIPTAPNPRRSLGRHRLPCRLLCVRAQRLRPRRSARTN